MDLSAGILSPTGQRFPPTAAASRIVAGMRRAQETTSPSHMPLHAAITRQRCRQRNETTRLWHRQPTDRQNSTDTGRTRNRASARARARASTQSESTDKHRGQERDADNQARAVLLYRTATENSQELTVDIMVDTVFGGYQCPDSMLNTGKGIASFYDRYEKTLEKHTSGSWYTLIAGVRTSERSWRNLSGAL